MVRIEVSVQLTMKLYRLEISHESGAQHMVKKQYIEVHRELHKKVTAS